MGTSRSTAARTTPLRPRHPAPAGAAPSSLGAEVGITPDLRALFALRPGALWRFVRAQPLSYWCIHIYLFFEYVRPQQIYTFLEGPPWTQISLIVALVALLLEGRSLHADTPADKSLLYFTAVLLLSCVTAISSEVAFDKVAPAFLAWVMIYFLITATVRTEKQFFVFMLAWILYSFKMSQHGARAWAESGFAFLPAGVSGAPGWFQNSGEFGVQMTVFVPIVCYFIAALWRWWSKPVKILFALMVITALMGTIGANTRGALVGLGAVLLFMVIKSKYKIRGLVWAAAAVFAVSLVLPAELMERFDAIGEDRNSQSRQEFWKFGIATFQEYPVLGIGYANWLPHYSSRTGHTGLPHNIIIEAGAELGALGLAGFFAMVISTFVVNARTRRLARSMGERGRFLAAMGHGLDVALVGFFVSGQFVTVLYYPFLWINLALTVALHRAARDTARQVGRTAAPAAQAPARRRRPAPPLEAPGPLLFPPVPSPPPHGG